MTSANGNAQIFPRFQHTLDTLAGFEQGKERMHFKECEFIKQPNYVQQWRLKLPSHGGLCSTGSILKHYSRLGRRKDLRPCFHLFNFIFLDSSKRNTARRTQIPSVYSMSLAVLGAAVLGLCIVAYAMSHNTESVVDLHEPKVFQERKELYRKQRDGFRSNTRAMEELVQWKDKNNDYDYMELYVSPLYP